MFAVPPFWTKPSSPPPAALLPRNPRRPSGIPSQTTAARMSLCQLSSMFIREIRG
jgi:hypothetical protein